MTEETPIYNYFVQIEKIAVLAKAGSISTESAVDQIDELLSSICQEIIP